MKVNIMKIIHGIVCTITAVSIFLLAGCNNGSLVDSNYYTANYDDNIQVSESTDKIEKENGTEQNIDSNLIVGIN